jgi:hypothetical protein
LQGWIVTDINSLKKMFETHSDKVLNMKMGPHFCLKLTVTGSKTKTECTATYFTQHIFIMLRKNHFTWVETETICAGSQLP